MRRKLDSQKALVRVGKPLKLSERFQKSSKSIIEMLALSCAVLGESGSRGDKGEKSIPDKCNALGVVSTAKRKI